MSKERASTAGSSLENPGQEKAGKRAGQSDGGVIGDSDAGESRQRPAKAAWHRLAHPGHECPDGADKELAARQMCSIFPLSFPER
jgi:hypothetical protein